jgi:hypothetical protein
MLERTLLARQARGQKKESAVSPHYRFAQLEKRSFVQRTL